MIVEVERDGIKLNSMGQGGGRIYKFKKVVYNFINTESGRKRKRKRW